MGQYVPSWSNSPPPCSPSPPATLRRGQGEGREEECLYVDIILHQLSQPTCEKTHFSGQVGVRAENTHTHTHIFKMEIGKKNECIAKKNDTTYYNFKYFTIGRFFWPNMIPIIVKKVNKRA
jgi:hypothetical protein